jgi:hypothetical protein
VTHSTTATESAAPAAGSAAAGAGLLEDAKALWREGSALFHDRLQLAALETRLAGESLVAMIVAGVIVAVLVVAAWLGLVGAAMLVLVGFGVGAGTALLLGVLVNLAVALVLCQVIRGKSRYLLWAATLRSVRPSPAGADESRGS